MPTRDLLLTPMTMAPTATPARTGATSKTATVEEKKPKKGGCRGARPPGTKIGV
jgi:hypothetical protein